MEAAVALKPKVILVGGMDYNVPSELKERFEIVKHLSQGMRYQTLPKADYVFVLTQFTHHNLVDQVKRESAAQIVYLKQGWPMIKEELERRSILQPQAPDGKPENALETTPEEKTTLGLPASEIWSKFGEKMIEACRGTLKIGERVSEKELLEILAMAGPPPEDCKPHILKLHLSGVMVPTGDGCFMLASSDEEYYEERVTAAPQPSKRRKAKEAEPEKVPSERPRPFRMTTPALVVRLIAGLRPGPYLSKRAIHKEMMKYDEFAALTHSQLIRYVDRAIVTGIVDDTHKNLYVKHANDIVLTKRKELPPDLEEPEIPKVQTAVKAQVQPLAATPPPPTGLSEEEAQKKWCFVVEKVRQMRVRLADILLHCRIEWMGGNNILVIFIPAVLSNCLKFLESTENWGFVTGAVQEQYSRDTVVRFMIDNGLRT